MRRGGAILCATFWAAVWLVLPAGPSDADVAACRSNFETGEAALDDGNLAGAERFFRAAIAAGGDGKKAAGCLIQTYGSLMGVYQFQRRLADEAEASERRLELREAELGKGHRDLMFEIHDLASLYLELEHPGPAARVMEQLLVFDIADLGPKHPTVADDHMFIAELYNRAGEAVPAARYYEDALALYEIVLPPGHPDIDRLLTRYAKLLEDTGDRQKAARLRARIGATGPR